MKIKNRLGFTSIFQTFSLFFDFSSFHVEVDYLTEILKKNLFPLNLIERYIKIYLHKKITETTAIKTGLKSYPKNIKNKQKTFLQGKTYFQIIKIVGTFLEHFLQNKVKIPSSLRTKVTLHKK